MHTTQLRHQTLRGMRVVMFPLIGACGSESGVQGDDLTEVIPVDTASPEPLSITIQEGMELVQQVLETQPFSISEVSEHYLRLMAEGDSTCPGLSTDLTGLVPVDGCTSESGVTYLGVSSYREENEFEIKGGTRSGFEMSADMEIIDSDGYSMEGGGYASFGQETLDSGGLLLSFMSLGGTWRYPVGSGALGQGISGEYMALLVIEDGSLSLTLDGALSVGSLSLYLDYLVYGGEGCDDGLTGVLAFRSPEGRWVRVDMGDDCDFCGQATRTETGEDLGSACLIDADPLDQAIVELRP